jgi:hypothetical protein
MYERKSKNKSGNKDVKVEVMIPRVMLCGNTILIGFYPEPVESNPCPHTILHYAHKFQVFISSMPLKLLELLFFHGQIVCI